MDLAYDHIQEQAFRENEQEEGQDDGEKAQEAPSLNNDIQEAYKVFSASPWGARIGGFLGSVVKQGESVYKEASQEITAVGSEATRGLTGWRDTLISHTRSLSLVNPGQGPGGEAGGQGASAAGSKELSTDEALQESETVLSRLRVEAAKRLKDIQRAEDAADEALLKFGSNVRDFLRDAISIAPPAGGAGGQGGSAVLFESKDAQGKRVIHTSRFDAQLHVIHTTADGFMKDPASAEFTSWAEGFDIGKKTDGISRDLAKYPELRATMERLVPDQIPYADFWKRYYFLRNGIETAEARRRDLLKAASAEEEVAWDEDSDDEARPGKPTDKPARPASAGSSTTIHPAKDDGLLKPSEPRRSNDEKSQADSDGSYDVVGAASGVPSQAPSSPKESRKGDDSDEEEDWE